LGEGEGKAQWSHTSRTNGLGGWSQSTAGRGYGNVQPKKKDEKKDSLRNQGRRRGGGGKSLVSEAMFQKDRGTKGKVGTVNGKKKKDVKGRARRGKAMVQDQRGDKLTVGVGLKKKNILQMRRRPNCDSK